MEENKYLKQAKEELEYLSEDPDFQEMVKDRARFLRDVDIMKQVAKEDGEADGFSKGKAVGEASGFKKGEVSGFKKGEVSGLIKGENNAKIATAKRLLKMNIPIEQISIATELSVEEIKKLI